LYAETVLCFVLSKLAAVLRRASRSYVLFIAIGLVVGLAIAPVAFQTTESDGTVAVIPLSGGITGGTSSSVGSMLEQARENPDIDAVVIVANSGGGSAAASEELYLQAKRTAQEMPVVASVDASAASGAYYTIAPSDVIYAKPASLVGSVGVLANAPRSVEPNEFIGTTGSNKLSGFDDRGFYYLLENLGNSFYNAVETQRGDRLELSRGELAQAKIYSGTQAVENGMADRIGGRQAAVTAAAEEAGLENYEVRTLRPRGETVFLSRNNYLAADAPNGQMVSSDYFMNTDDNSPTFLMLPASYLGNDGEAVEPTTSVNATRTTTPPATTAEVRP
jgi:protease-4